MRDDACVAFLQVMLPRLSMRWAGFRKVRGQVCKRLSRRLQQLGLSDLDAYRSYLDAHPAEWDALDRMCRITISRFYRDRGVFDQLTHDLLPALAEQAADRAGATVRAWSAGCASGEEVYTLRIAWALAVQSSFPDVSLALTATDIDAHMLKRAAQGCYQRGTLKDLPDDWVDEAFERTSDGYCVRALYRTQITWLQQDIRETMPDGPFDLILCRNLVFMYFDDDLQRECLARLRTRLRPGGLLVLGKHEPLPEDAPGFAAVDAHRRIYRIDD